MSSPANGSHAFGRPIRIDCPPQRTIPAVNMALSLHVSGRAAHRRVPLHSTRKTGFLPIPEAIVEQYRHGPIPSPGQALMAECVVNTFRLRPRGKRKPQWTTSTWRPIFCSPTTRVNASVWINRANSITRHRSRGWSACWWSQPTIINNLLTGHSSHLLLRLAVGTAEGVLAGLAEIESITLRAAGLCRQLSILAGKPLVTRSRCDLNAIVRNVVKEYGICAHPT